MRLSRLLSAAFVLTLAAPVFAQEWVEFVSREDGFKIVFPSQPAVQDTTYTSQYGYRLPGRIYSAESGQQRFSVTAIDYRGIRTQGEARAKACPAGAETCRGGQVESVIGQGYWKQDVRGAITYALFKLLQRDAKLTHMSWDWQDLVEGFLLQLTNADESRTFAHVSMHDNRLYIVEGTVPKGSPEPGFFQQTLGYVDKEGNGIRYQSIYSNAYHGMGEVPVPPRTGGAGGAGAGALAAIAAPVQQSDATRVFVVSYVEVAPASESQAAALMRTYRDATRRDEGNLRAEVLQRSARPGHFVVLEEWRDEAARKNHRAAAQVTQFHEKLTPLRVSPYDERSHTGHAIGASGSPPSGAVLVVTHIDVIPAGAGTARDMLNTLAAATRKETGSLRYDALQGVRMNHFTVIEGWRDERARETHLSAAHTRTFRDDLMQLSTDGGLYDERLYRLLP